jgi:acetolactate synthase-1/2/3 large subunit
MFGLPGGEVVFLIDACRNAGVRFILTGHEASAAFMAEVAGQLTGRPGVCVSTLGPGAMNLLLGLADARLDRGPVLALTAQVSTAIERHYTHQRLPLGAIFGQVCKASVAVNGTGTENLAARCLDLAMAPPPGPVHLALPSDLAAQAEAPGAHQAVSAPAEPAAHDEAGLSEIAGIMRGARRPLVMVGVGCLPTDVPALRRLVDAAELPFVVTPKAKGCLREDAPGFLGVISGMAIDKTLLETVDHADLLVGVGFDPVECDKPWYLGRRIVNVSRYRTAEGDYEPLESLYDIGPALDWLRPRIAPRPWPAQVLAERRRAAEPDPLPASGGLSPLAAVRALREVIPAEAVMTCDVGSHKYFIGQFWRAFDPQTFFMSNGLSAMGYGVPAAIAAQIHFPDRPVVSVVGDGGLLMMLHNLIVLQQQRLPVVIVCFVDGSLSLIRVAQERRGVQPYGVDFPAPDFSEIAQSCGIRGARVGTLDELKKTVEGALAARAPAVVHVPIDTREYQAYC